MIDASLPVQKAIRARLIADAAVNAIVAGRIYDAVPANAVKPYLSFGTFQVLPEAGDCLEGVSIFITLDGWAPGPDSVTTKRLGAAVAQSLQWAEMQLDEGQRLVICSVEQTNYLREPDGLTGHAVVTVRAQTEPLP